MDMMVRANREAARECKETEAAAKKAEGGARAASLRPERNKNSVTAAKRSQRVVQREQTRVQALQAERGRRAGLKYAARFTER